MLNVCANLANSLLWKRCFVFAFRFQLGRNIANHFGGRNTCVHTGYEYVVYSLAVRVIWVSSHVQYFLGVLHKFVVCPVSHVRLYCVSEECIALQPTPSSSTFLHSPFDWKTGSPRWNRAELYPLFDSDSLDHAEDATIMHTVTSSE